MSLFLLRRLFLGLLLVSASAATPQGSTFTYQGQLRQNGVVVNGNHNLSFALFDAASGGAQVGSTVTANNWPIIDGLFTIDLDFPGAFSGDQRWLEVSSTSNFETFQANRLRCRFREKGARQTTLCHTLNGSALALPRIVAALLENNQTPDGIKIPSVLVPYAGFGMIS